MTDFYYINITKFTSNNLYFIQSIMLKQNDPSNVFKWTSFYSICLMSLKCIKTDTLGCPLPVLHTCQQSWGHGTKVSIFYLTSGSRSVLEINLETHNQLSAMEWNGKEWKYQFITHSENLILFCKMFTSFLYIIHILHICIDVLVGTIKQEFLAWVPIEQVWMLSLWTVFRGPNNYKVRALRMVWNRAPWKHFV